MSDYASILNQLDILSTPQKAATSGWFFKTGPGDYGEGDTFIGVTIPEIRMVVKQHYKTISLSETEKLIQSKIHEHRMCGLLILTEKAAHASDKELETIYMLYRANTPYINNWDLVDSSAHKIVGRYLRLSDKRESILNDLACSGSLWEQRIAIIATFWFIRENDFTDTLRVSSLLMHHKHDLIHKAVGWMLREVGKRDRKVEEMFLKRHYKTMPRTMLRYAIERFEPELRKQYLLGQI